MTLVLEVWDGIYSSNIITIDQLVSHPHVVRYKDKDKVNQRSETNNQWLQTGWLALPIVKKIDKLIQS